MGFCIIFFDVDAYHADFKYKKGSDSVMVVKKEDYDSCNTKSPIRKMDDGNSTFTFDRSGPFFFIGGNADNCQKGQKLIVVVLAIRHKPQSAPPAVTPARSPAAGSPPAVSPGRLSPQPGPSHYSPAPSPSDRSGSTRFGGSSGVGLGVKVGVILIFGSFGRLV